MPHVMEVNPAELFSHPLNLQVFGAEPYDQDFNDHVSTYGVETVIEVIERDDRLVVIKGHRRRQAAIAAGQTAVLVVVRDDLNDLQAERQLLHDNDPKLRRKLNALHLGKIAAELEKRLGSQGKAADALGVSRDTVNRAIGVNKTVEQLRMEGNHAEANEISAAANISVSKAVEVARQTTGGSPPRSRGESASPAEPQGPNAKNRRAALGGLAKHMDAISSGMGRASREDGGLSPEAEEAIKAYNELQGALSRWMTKS